MSRLIELRAVVGDELRCRLEDFATRRADTMPTADEWQRVLALRAELRAIDETAARVAKRRKEARNANHR